MDESCENWPSPQMAQNCTEAGTLNANCTKITKELPKINLTQRINKCSYAIPDPITQVILKDY
jgi:hypothetical protein